MAGVESAGKADPVLQAEFEIGRVVALVLLATKGTRRVGQFVAQRPVPVDRLDESVDLVPRHAGCVESSDQPAHAGASDVVDRYVVLLKPPQHPDVGQAERAAALQHEADGRPMGRGRQRARAERKAAGEGKQRTSCGLPGTKETEYIRESMPLPC